MKRFYRQVTVEPDEGGWRVLLDGRGIKTAGGRPQTVPTRALAEALAAEWDAQGEEIDPATLKLRHLADYTIDIVAPDRAKAIHGLLAYAETDTLCYRAEAGEALHLRQLEVWEPLIAAAELRWDVHFERVGGVIHRQQPLTMLARMEAVLETHSDFDLSALVLLASLSASLIVGLAAVCGETDADAETLWGAANLEEDWQAELWGKDAEAEAHRARRLADFAAAMRFAALARGD
jgi:chaperone required for assembly of F1-ATPase